MDEELRNPFKSVQSSYLQKKAYKSFGLVVQEMSVKLIIIDLQEPVERELGRKIRKVGKRFKFYSDCAYDVPLEESFQQLLSDTTVFDEVQIQQLT